MNRKIDGFPLRLAKRYGKLMISPFEKAARGTEEEFMVKKWYRSGAALLATALLAWSFPLTAAAKNGYYDRALDDNRQQLYLLGGQSPQSYCSLLTIGAAQRQELWNLAHRITANCRTDAERAAAVYDWVTKNIYYDWDGIWGNDLPMEDPYSVYTTRRAVCEGYSTLYADWH